jgi:phenylacetate-coenzyme A ligase PaaK-like adenylate-forming protein
VDQTPGSAPNPPSLADTRLGDPPPAELLDPAERMGVDQLRALQLQRLRDTLHRAYTGVPFYRQAFDAAGVHPDDCRELTDLAKFPTATKADLRDNYPFGMFAVPQDPIIRYRTRDLTTLRPGTTRPAMRRMEKILGRDDDMIILRGVNLFPTQIEEIVLGTPALAPHFQLVLRTRGGWTN